MRINVTSKGRITIPRAVCRKLGIKPGTRIQVFEENAKIVLQPITREYIYRLRGKYKGRGLLKKLMAEKKWESGEAQDQI